MAQRPGILFIDGLPGSGSTAAAEIGRRCPDSRDVLEMHPNHHLQRRPIRLSEAANTAQGPSAAATVTSATAATISRSCNRPPVGPSPFQATEELAASGVRDSRPSTTAETGWELSLKWLGFSGKKVGKSISL